MPSLWLTEQQDVGISAPLAARLKAKQESQREQMGERGEAIGEMSPEQQRAGRAGALICAGGTSQPPTPTSQPRVPQVPIMGTEGVLRQNSRPLHPFHVASPWHRAELHGWSARATDHLQSKGRTEENLLLSSPFQQCIPLSQTKPNEPPHPFRMPHRPPAPGPLTWLRCALRAADAGDAAEGRAALLHPCGRRDARERSAPAVTSAAPSLPPLMPLPHLTASADCLRPSANKRRPHARPASGSSGLSSPRRPHTGGHKPAGPLPGIPARRSRARRQPEGLNPTLAVGFGEMLRALPACSRLIRRRGRGGSASWHRVSSSWASKHTVARKSHGTARHSLRTLLGMCSSSAPIGHRGFSEFPPSLWALLHGMGACSLGNRCWLLFLQWLSCILGTPPAAWGRHGAQRPCCYLAMHSPHPAHGLSVFFPLWTLLGLAAKCCRSSVQQQHHWRGRWMGISWECGTETES